MSYTRSPGLPLVSLLLACGPPDDPGSTTETPGTASSEGSSTPTGEAPTTTQADTTGLSTTDDGGTGGESAGELCGDPGQVRWIRRFDAASDSGAGAMSLVVDGAGNVILVGRLGSALDGPDELFDQPPGIAYVVKFDPEGELLWVRHTSGTAEQRIDAVAVDEDGTIALGGKFSGTIDVGGGPMVSASFMDIFVANLTADGELVWGRSFTGSDMFDAGLVSDVAIADGETVFLAHLEDSGDFGGGPIGGLGGGDNFAVKLDAGGGHVWSRVIGSGEALLSTSVTIDVTGRVWATGRFDHEADFGDGPVLVDQTALYVARWTADGEPLDVLVTTGESTTDAPYPSALGTAADGRVFLGGSFSGTLGFGGAPLAGPGALDGFVVALDGDGAPQWQRALGHPVEEKQTVFELAADAAGRTAIVGDFEGAIDFGGGVSLTGNSVVDGYVAKFDVDGAPLWARAFGAETWGLGGEVAIDGDGAVYAVGIFRDTMTIDGHTLGPANDYDTVLMKLCP